MMGERIQRRVFVSGRVQGVGFRMSTVRAAMGHVELSGFVRNLPDGRVEAVFAGEESDVLEMVEWCRKGPPFAKVIDIQIIEEEFDKTLPRFSIRK
jgi:acylphosphatase